MPNETRSAENRIQHKIERMRVYEQRMKMSAEEKEPEMNV